VINNLNGPSVNISGQTNNICNGGMSGAATATVTGGTGPFTYSWNTSPVQASATATGLGAGPYTVIVTDATGCTNSQTVTITEPAAMTASITVTPAACGSNDGTASANPSGGASPYSYSWTTLQSTQTISGLSAGIYSVTVTDVNGCSQTFSATVTNSNGPTAVAGTSASILPGASAQLTSSGGVTYTWSPAAGLSNPNISDPTASPSITTTYCVIVADANSCVDSACVTIFVEAACGNYYLPNAFSPNGDNENDGLQLYLENLNCVQEFHLAVYDRWGEILFDTTDPAASWDGVHDGKIMNSQVLSYYLHIIFTDGKEVTTKGNVSLVR
jgi:gliding motility-associated-like protein